MMTLTDQEVALILARKLYHRQTIEGESPSFKVVTTPTSVSVQHKGGPIDPELLKIAPQLDTSPLPTKATPSIEQLETEFNEATSYFKRIASIIPEGEFKARLEVCRACNEWIEDENHPNGYCDKGEARNKLIWLTKERCPDNKWLSALGSQP